MKTKNRGILIEDPNLRNRYAVADAYENWYDLTDNEVLEILNKATKTN